MSLERCIGNVTGRMHGNITGWVNRKCHWKGEKEMSLEGCIGNVTGGLHKKCHGKGI